MSSKSPSNKTPSSSGKSLKQGTLFSFFSKKTESTAKYVEQNLTNPMPATAEALSTPLSSKASSVTPSTGASAAMSASRNTRDSKAWEKVTVGMRIAVYWKDDRKYYEAKVTGQKNKNLKSEFSLMYDNGDTERIDLATERFRFLDNIELPRKKRRRIEEESEEEFEFDENEFDDDDEMEADRWVRDDDKEDDWMVTDDEEDSKSAEKSRRKASTNAVKVTRVPSPPITPAPRKLETKFSKIASTPAPIAKSPSTVSISTRVSDAPLPYIDKEVNPRGAHVHNHLQFLRNPRDNEGRPVDHPDYNPRTLKVDYNELERHLGGKISPGVQQWWDLKAQYFDTVLLFKTGKFYEMFHMDADIGVQELEFIYMKGKVAHAGFPEISYGQFADRLVRAGYKVARVEQTETPDMLTERRKQTTGKKPQVVNREVCSIMTLGTRTFCYMDDVNSVETDGTASTKPLLAIKEIPTQHDGEGGPVCEYGITLVDASRAVITIGQFADDILRSRMNTLLTTFEPCEIILEGGDVGASTTLLSLIEVYKSRNRCPAVIEKISPLTSFPKSTALSADIRRKMERKGAYIKPWDVNETLDELHRKAYFPRASRENESSMRTNRWPMVLRAVVDGHADLALSSFGAVLFYLQRNLIDQEILSMGAIKAYIPPTSSEVTNTQLQDRLTRSEELDVAPPMTPVPPEPRDPQVEIDVSDEMGEEADINHMALDGTTLQNLEVLTNSTTFTPAGSLWSKLNATKTPHGSRMLRAWLLRPLFRKADIDRRCDAVEELVSNDARAALTEARRVLSKCGDIERLLSRVHSMSVTASQPDAGGVHPNERAVLYEGVTHTKRKVGDFSKLLRGLRQANKIPDVFHGIDIKSGLLRKIVFPISKGGCFPEMEQELDWFFENFDCEEAAKGLFEPSRGMDTFYDEACDTVHRIRRELEDYKEEMCSDILRGSSRTSWKYINTKDDSKDKYLIELPANIRVPEDFIVKGKRGSGHKQVNKYRTQVVEELVKELETALDIQKDRKARGMQLIFAKFDSSRSLWAAAAQTTALLDALGSLAEASAGPGFCRPTILPCPPHVNPSLHFIQARHPCVDNTYSRGQFIPNDLTLGGYEQSSGDGQDSARVLLLSGPNMGGKSTLLRQTCLIAILAQIGCFVPAEECALTPVDRIFTRLGACDRILLGQSTFFVELAETASALRGATRRSLVIMDELGRGTSTFDGTAIASACVQHLVRQNQCLTLFATHYHSLLTEWQYEPCVRLGHMECYVENEVQESSESEPAEDHSITFLYTLGRGPCPRSFGVNVAKLAGLPDEVLSRAKKKSASFEIELSTMNTEDHLVERADELCAQLAAAIEGEDCVEADFLWECLNR